MLNVYYCNPLNVVNRAFANVREAVEFAERSDYCCVIVLNHKVIASTAWSADPRFVVGADWR